MSKDSNVFSYIFTWYALGDACPVCQALYVKEFFGQSNFQSTLEYSIFCKIWDLDTDSSLTHPNCRCNLGVTVNIDLEKMPYLSRFHKKLGEKIGLAVRVEHPSIASLRSEIQALSEEISNLNMDYSKLLELELLLNRTLILLEKSTGSKELQQAINMIQKLISSIRMAQFTINAFYTTSGPIGWALALSGFAITAFTLAETYVETQR